MPSFRARVTSRRLCSRWSAESLLALRFAGRWRNRLLFFSFNTPKKSSAVFSFLKLRITSEKLAVLDFNELREFVLIIKNKVNSTTLDEINKIREELKKVLEK